MYAIKSAAQVAIALMLSYGIWGVVGLNAWIATLRKGILYNWYQICFIFFLALLFWIYMLRKEHSRRQMVLLGYGIVIGYLSSGLAICLWPLLAPNGLERFLHMRWDLAQLPLDALISGGCLNGFIVSCILLLIRWGSDWCTKQFLPNG